MTINREDEPQWSRALYKLTNRRGVDVVVDNVGAATLGQSMRACRIGGRILIVGGTSGYGFELNLAQLFARHISLIGSTMGPHRDYVAFMEQVFAGRIKAVIGARLALERRRGGRRAFWKTMKSLGKWCWRCKPDPIPRTPPPLGLRSGHL